MKLKKNNLDHIELIVRGMHANIDNPSKFKPWSGNEPGWFSYFAPDGVKITLRVEKNDYIYVSIDGPGFSKSEIFSSYFMKGWCSFSSTTKRMNTVFKMAQELADKYDGRNTSKSLEDLFPELAQQELEKAVWDKDE